MDWIAHKDISFWVDIRNNGELPEEYSCATVDSEAVVMKGTSGQGMDLAYQYKQKKYSSRFFMKANEKFSFRPQIDFNESSQLKALQK
jgi:hypothetical protein